MTYLDYLNTEAIELSRVVPRISVWDTETVRLYQSLDMVSEEDGIYGGLSVSFCVFCSYFPASFLFIYLFSSLLCVDSWKMRGSLYSIRVSLLILVLMMCILHLVHFCARLLNLRSNLWYIIKPTGCVLIVLLVYFYFHHMYLFLEFLFSKY